MSKIALVDDDRNILTSVAMTLEAEGFEVETYHDGQQALDAFNRKLPDMAVLDIKMPRMDGMDLLQRLRQKTSMPVIFLTSKDDEIDEVLGLRMGADDYVKKPFSQRLLVERIRALLRRQEAVAGDVVGDTEETKVMERGELRMDPLRHSVAWKGQDVSLTVTEFLLLQALAQRPGFVKSRDQLMDVAYDDQVYVDDRTIDSHIKRLRKKMRSVDPDVVIVTQFVNDAILLQRQMRELGFMPKAFLGTGAGQATISFAEALWDDVNGIFSSSYPPDINPDGLSARAQADLKEFKTRYVAKYKVEPAVQESLGFVVGLALMEDIIGNAKSTSPADLAAVAKTIDLPGGTYINGWGMKFDATGQNVMAEGAVVQWQDQRMVVVYPDSVSMAKPIMVPLPGSN